MKERTGAREGDTQGVREAPSRAPVFSCAHYFQAPATQANGLLKSKGHAVLKEHFLDFFCCSDTYLNTAFP